MRKRMKGSLILSVSILSVLAVFASCAGTKESSDKSAADSVGKTDISETAVNSIVGQWDVENVVENDSSYVRPSEIEPGVTSYIDFRDDDTFGVMTDCNHIGGRYQQTGNSIHLSEISATEMACDNMELEEMLKKILPMVNAIDCINDSITRLNTDKGDSYIVLKKKSIKQK